MGIAYLEIQHHLPPKPWKAIVFIILIVAILLPAILLAEIRPPMFVLSPAGPIFQMSLGIVTLIFIGELLCTATLTSGLIGWWISRTKLSTLAMALSGFVFALGPGHNIPFIGGIGGVMKEWAIMVMVIIVSTFVLVESYEWFSRTKGHKFLECRRL